VAVKVGTGVLVGRAGATLAFRGPHAANNRTANKKVSECSQRIGGIPLFVTIGILAGGYTGGKRAAKVYHRPMQI
jgi:hypothetical protein